MVVIFLERVPARLRGELSRWMIEPKTGVFVGRVSAMVRDRLWTKVRAQAKEGAGMLAYAAPNEQGFAITSFGTPDRSIADWEGLSLICVPKEATTQHARKRGSANSSEKGGD